MTAKSRTKKVFSLISDEKLRQLYSTMLKYRILETHARTIVRGLPSLRGHEAAVAGAAIDLRRGDAIFSADGTAGSYLQGSELSVVFERLHKRAQTKKKFEIPGLASQVAIATGSVLASSRKQSAGITLALLTDSAVQLDSARESLTFAGASKLPIIYLRVAPASGEDFPPSLDLPLIPVDANDVVAVYRVAYECILRARQGGGPSVIECRTFTTKRDPIRSMEQYLSVKGLFTEAWKQEMIRAFEREVHQAASKAKKTMRKTSVPSSQTTSPFLYLL
ncbi:MAG TPA: thiamine pyrophosphate-dependent enzyme [Pseudacidobacterium sp.]|jgi:TPP-dependent pyruvate/acetoin dehydrogenase alpha subunit|nr:thiamine pyrophosphate-dependent enzyme [Pseudacidobacterium sp.]